MKKPINGIEVLGDEIGNTGYALTLDGKNCKKITGYMHSDTPILKEEGLRVIQCE